MIPWIKIEFVSENHRTFRTSMTISEGEGIARFEKNSRSSLPVGEIGKELAEAMLGIRGVRTVTLRKNAIAVESVAKAEWELIENAVIFELQSLYFRKGIRVESIEIRKELGA